MKNLNQLTLSLFNVVIAKTEAESRFIPEHGVFVQPNAVWAMSDIEGFLHSQKLSGQELNKTFHKSWKKVQESSRFELAIHQILHYMSTYGTNFTGEAYIPDEVLEIPELQLKVTSISGLPKEDIIEKALDLFRSGIALKEETMKDVFSLLKQLDYSFTGKEGIKNKEAKMILAKDFGVYPDSPEEMIRFLVFTCTDSTSLVKSKEVIDMIEHSGKDLSSHIEKYGIEKLATVFNRFKPLFLAMKRGNYSNTFVINKISKKSKTLHKPMVENALNNVTSRVLTDKDTHWLDNATVFALFKALAACHSRKEGQDTFLYRIRNGKSWTVEGKASIQVAKKNYFFILEYMKKRFNGEGTIFIPEDVVYALPTSEKMFVGNVPTGTKFLGDDLAVGVYWRNSWGANDIDLSGLNIAGKIGWNAAYNDHSQRITYSGDKTSAPNGAVEYLRVQKEGVAEPTLVLSNVFNGSHDCNYKIIVGKGDDVNYDYMMNPNKVMVDEATQSVQKQTILGLINTEENGQKSFIIMNVGAGSAHISGYNENARKATKALYQQWRNPMSLNIVLEELGYKVVSKIKEDTVVDIDLSLDKLEKSTFINLFSEKKVDKVKEKL